MATLPTHTPPLAALRAFEAVARLGSLSRAALELNVTKSAVSHQLRALEADLGCRSIAARRHNAPRANHRRRSRSAFFSTTGLDPAGQCLP
ncbi:MAG TPA: LysR family transcriptional regulator [Bordetella sp.]|uniref:LysR family transcriptional regulator n=1 Tax=Bordetella sp. TaxID=28081 RepID=UPI002ED5A567